LVNQIASGFGRDARNDPRDAGATTGSWSVNKVSNGEWRWPDDVGRLNPLAGGRNGLDRWPRAVKLMNQESEEDGKGKRQDERGREPVSSFDRHTGRQIGKTARAVNHSAIDEMPWIRLTNGEANHKPKVTHE